jgi:hypothetical protein
VYFYELHEADDELAIGITLAHDEAFAPSEFLAMVETARSRVIETFPEETLIEAIALELEREHDFAAALDSRLVAAVGVSSEEGETRLLTHEGLAAHAADEGEEAREEKGALGIFCFNHSHSAGREERGK